LSSISTKFPKNYEVDESNIIEEEIMDNHNKENNDTIINSFEIFKPSKNENNINFDNKSYEKNKINKEFKNLKNLFSCLNSEINIKNLKRPFSIYLHDLSFNQNFDCLNEKSKEFFYKMNIKIQIYCGSHEYTKPRNLEWKSNYFHKNRHIRKAIEFDLGYDSLPMFASIVFKIKVVLYNKLKQPIKSNTFWTNFKLFDHNRRLKTGK